MFKPLRYILNLSTYSASDSQVTPKSRAAGLRLIELHGGDTRSTIRTVVGSPINRVLGAGCISISDGIVHFLLPGFPATLARAVYKPLHIGFPPLQAFAEWPSPQRPPTLATRGAVPMHGHTTRRGTHGRRGLAQLRATPPMHWTVTLSSALTVRLPWPIDLSICANYEVSSLSTLPLGHTSPSPLTPRHRPMFTGSDPPPPLPPPPIPTPTPHPGSRPSLCMVLGRNTPYPPPPYST